MPPTLFSRAIPGVRSRAAWFTQSEGTGPQAASDKPQIDDNTMKTPYYIGLDVHKESIAVAYTKAGERKEPTSFGECGGSVLAAERCLRCIASRLGVPRARLR